MKKILKYKTFNTSMEFEIFQNENEVDICSVTPIVLGMNLNTTESSVKACSTDGNTEIGVFIVYVDKEEIQD